MLSGLKKRGAIGSASPSFDVEIQEANPAGKRAVLYGRQEPTAPVGVPQEEFDRCRGDLADDSVVVTVTGPVGNNGIQAEGVPASCMNLAAVMDRDTADGPLPQPCGSACLLYYNLSAAEYEEMRTFFNAVKKA
ncbi:hypothetical protein ACJ41O_012866 [Fusarium nematophilum]